MRAPPRLPVGWPKTLGMRRLRHQVSLTSGTVLHNTKTPLILWFWTAYLMTTDKRGVSALLLQRQLGLRRYETAWMMLHKLRRAMVNAAREPLHGEVEVDETWVGGTQAGIRGSRQLEGRAALVLVAVEKRGRATGASAWPSSLTSKRPPSTTSSRRTWLRERPSPPMGSKVSGAWKRLGSSLSPALSHGGPHCAKVPNR